MTREEKRAAALAARRATAERLHVEATELEAVGRTEEALALYRRAARLGDTGAQTNLGVMLTDLGGEHHAEGMRWYRRAAARGDRCGAWNAAVQYRIAGDRRWYLYWLREAARLGDEDAATMVAEIDRRIRDGRSWGLYRDIEVDAGDVCWMIGFYQRGEMTAEALAVWAADTVALRSTIALAEERRRDIVLVLRELSDPARRLTRQRAKELVFWLS